MIQSKVREAVVAGQFYPENASELKSQIETFVDKKAKKIDALGCILPHAGFMYSGKVAALTVSRINITDKVILLGPNHTGLGQPYSIMTDGSWQTPLGEVKIDSGLAKEILGLSDLLKGDTLAHAQEHSLEVELPILQYFRSNFEIVPIAFLSDDVDELKEIGYKIAEAVKNKPKGSIMLVASSDMTHYEPEDQAKAKDKQAIDAILELDEVKLMERIRRLNITMCGYAPVIVMLSAVKALGAKSVELVSYQTSGDVTGDKESVVGYAGIVIY